MKMIVKLYSFFRKVITRQIPRIKFVDINFRDYGNRTWLGSGLVSEVKHDQFFISWVKSEARGKLTAAFLLHFCSDFWDYMKECGMKIKAKQRKKWRFLKCCIGDEWGFYVWWVWSFCVSGSFRLVFSLTSSSFVGGFLRDPKKCSKIIFYYFVCNSPKYLITYCYMINLFFLKKIIITRQIYLLKKFFIFFLLLIKRDTWK